MENYLIINSILSYILLGTIFFAASTIGMIVFFGISLKNVGKNVTALIFILTLSTAIPFGLASLKSPIKTNSQASESVAIENSEIVRIDNNSFLVTVKTSKPTFIHLNYKDNEKSFNVPILSTSTPQPRIDHSFIVPDVGPKGGIATIISDSNNFHPNNQTIEIHDQ